MTSRVVPAPVRAETPSPVRQGPRCADPLPWRTTEPCVEGAWLRVFVRSAGDGRITRFSARRASARTLAMQDGLRALHRYVDARLRERLAEPAQATAVHAALDAHAERGRARALVDGGVVLEVRVRLSALGL